jgi:hypothetical protein
MNDLKTTKDLKPALSACQLFEACDGVWVYLIDGRMHANVAHKSLAVAVDREVKDPVTQEVVEIIPEILNEFDWELKLPDGTTWTIPDQELAFGEGIFYEFPQETRFNRDTFVTMKTTSGEIITVQFWFSIPHNVDMIWDYLDRAADHESRGRVVPEHEDVTVDTSHREPTGDEDDDRNPFGDDFDDTIPGGL